MDGRRRGRSAGTIFLAIMLKITLKRDREKPIRMGHPWVFSGAIERVDGEGAPGDACIVCTASGEVLGHGYYNPKSSIAARILSFGHAPFSVHTLRDRISAAVRRRAGILGHETDCCRLVNSEGDLLPGLVVDRYGCGLCVQVLTAGMERYRESVLGALLDGQQPEFIYERSDGESRLQEGLEQRQQCLHGTLPSSLEARENGLRFLVDPAGGQKTGFFTDQRENRLLLRGYASGRTACDCFAYTGGFSLNALRGGASSVTVVDASADAVTLAKRNTEINGFPLRPDLFISADVFCFLRNPPARYDLMVLDPPKFAKHQRDVNRAARGYKDINLLAIRNMAPEGLLFTFSCSQAVDARLFRQIVFAAAADSGRQAQVLHVLSQPPDHPVDIAHREGEYLKGLVLRIV